MYKFENIKTKFSFNFKQCSSEKEQSKYFQKNKYFNLSYILVLFVNIRISVI